MFRPDRDVGGGAGGGADGPPSSFLSPFAPATGLVLGLGFDAGLGLDLGFS